VGENANGSTKAYRFYRHAGAMVGMLTNVRRQVVTMRAL
jgi:hypothetical protein